MNIFVADEQDDPLNAEALRDLAESVLAAEGLPDDAEMTLLFVGAEQIAEYNLRFLHRSGPTDVLAFPLEELVPGDIPEPRPGDPPLNVGDVVIAPAYVRDQAERQGVGFDEEMSLMVVHGTLHLLGYDHADDLDAEAMEARERELLRARGRAKS